MKPHESSLSRATLQRYIYDKRAQRYRTDVVVFDDEEEEDEEEETMVLSHMIILLIQC